MHRSLESWGKRKMPNFTGITSKRLPKKMRQSSQFPVKERRRLQRQILLASLLKLAIRCKGGISLVHTYVMRVLKMAKEQSSKISFSAIFLRLGGPTEIHEASGRGTSSEGRWEGRHRQGCGLLCHEYRFHRDGLPSSSGCVFKHTQQFPSSRNCS